MAGSAAGSLGVGHDSDTDCRSSISHLPPTSLMVTWNRFCAAVVDLPAASIRWVSEETTTTALLPSKLTSPAPETVAPESIFWLVRLDFRVLLFACHWVALAGVRPASAAEKSASKLFSR